MCVIPSQVPSRARYARAHRSFFRGAGCTRPRSQVSVRAHMGCAGNRKSFFGRDARAHIRKILSGRAMRAPMFASCVPGAQFVRPRLQVVIRFSVSRPFRLSGARGAHRCIAKRLGVATREMQWARQSAPGIASFERDAVG